MVDFSQVNKAVLGAFAEDVTLAGYGTVKAVFDSRHYDLEDGEIGGSSRVTSLTMTATDADRITIGGVVITARGTDYLARDKRPDGEGLTVVEVELAP